MSLSLCTHNVKKSKKMVGNVICAHHEIRSYDAICAAQIVANEVVPYILQGGYDEQALLQLAAWCGAVSLAGAVAGLIYFSRCDV